MPSFTIEQIARRVGGTVIGRNDLAVTGVAQLDDATAGQLTFVRDAKNAERWQASRASAAVVTRGVTLEPGDGRALIAVDDADLAVASVLELFAPPPPRPAPGVHPSAVIDTSAVIGRNVAVGPHCFIGRGVRIGDDCLLHPSVTILDETTVGARTELYSGVVIRDRCSIGDDVILHPNVVIGADGFGYAFDKKNKAFVKIPHIGTVRIDNRVELGAGVCVDRGKFAATVIGEGTKIDNLSQIGHNVRIGRHCVLSGQVGIAGSAVIGDYVMMGGKVAIKDNISVGAGARLAACSAVMDDVPPGATWGGVPARDIRDALREAAVIRKLPELVRQFRKG